MEEGWLGASPRIQTDRKGLQEVNSGGGSAGIGAVEDSNGNIFCGTPGSQPRSVES